MPILRACLFNSDNYVMTPNPKEKAEKPKQLLRPTDPTKAEKFL